MVGTSNESDPEMAIEYICVYIYIIYILYMYTAFNVVHPMP
jgi:hypothetical protein